MKHTAPTQCLPFQPLSGKLVSEVTIAGRRLTSYCLFGHLLRRSGVTIERMEAVTRTYSPFISLLAAKADVSRPAQLAWRAAQAKFDRLAPKQADYDEEGDHDESEWRYLIQLVRLCHAVESSLDRKEWRKLVDWVKTCPVN